MTTTDRSEWFDYWTSIPRYVREARSAAHARIAERKLRSAGVEIFDLADKTLAHIQAVFRSSEAQMRKAQKDAIKAGTNPEGTPNA